MEKQFDRIPEHLKPKDHGTDTLFKSGLMEKLTRTHISIPVTMHLCIVTYVSYLGLQQFSIQLFIPLFAAGVLFWTFSEYWVHRYLYHVKTENKWLLRVQHMGHGIHHQFPKDATRLAMPPVPALLLMSLFYCVFYGAFWLFGSPELAILFFPGFVLGYTAYISIHYLQHVIKPPKFGPLNRLWKFHALHHYKYPETKAFGVSTKLWDIVFGTLPDEKV